MYETCNPQKIKQMLHNTNIYNIKDTLQDNKIQVTNAFGSLPTVYRQPKPWNQLKKMVLVYN